jgi:hypothetical protein
MRMIESALKFYMQAMVKRLAKEPGLEANIQDLLLLLNKVSPFVWHCQKQERLNQIGM